MLAQEAAIDEWKNGVMWGIGLAGVVVAALLAAVGILWAKLNSKSRDYALQLGKQQEAHLKDIRDLGDKYHAAIQANEKALTFIGQQVNQGGQQ